MTEFTIMLMAVVCDWSLSRYCWGVCFSRSHRTFIQFPLTFFTIPPMIGFLSGFFP